MLNEQAPITLKQARKSLHVFVQQEGAHFRVVYQRQYPQAVEELAYSERFKTREDAQKFIDTALLAQRIYRSLHANLGPRSQK